MIFINYGFDILRLDKSSISLLIPDTYLLWQFLGVFRRFFTFKTRSIHFRQLPTNDDAPNFRSRCYWLGPLRLLVNLFRWFLLTGVQEIGRPVFFLLLIFHPSCIRFIVLYIVCLGWPSFWKWLTISDFFHLNLSLKILTLRNSSRLFYYYENII